MPIESPLQTGCVSWVKMRLQGELRAAFQYLRGAYRTARERFHKGV